MRKPGFRILLYTSTLLVFLGGASLSGFPVQAQEVPIKKTAQTQKRPEKKDEVLVIGSYIKKTKTDAAAPVEVFTRADLEGEGVTTLADISLNLPVNVGSEAQPNIFLQNFSAGTAPLNFRGLGLGSTLVLLNGKRQTLSGAFAQDGSSFVDINAIPTIMVDRLEILKDGAAALYGSDAVAGVANYILRNRFEGTEIQAGYGITGTGNSKELDLGLLLGGKVLKAGHITFGINYFDRTALKAKAFSFTHPDQAGSGYSAAGQPGNYVVAGQGLKPDPDCEASGGSIRPGGPPCKFNFIDFAQIVIPEERLQAMLHFSYDLNETTELYIEALGARNKVKGQTLPGSLPSVVAGSPTKPAILASHPHNPFGADIIVAIQRPFGANSPPAVINRKNDTNRIVLGAKGEFNKIWNWDASYTYSQNKYFFNFPDVRLSRLKAAFLGIGGPNNNEYFNPFGKQSGNSQTVIDDIATEMRRNAKTSLHTIDLLTTGSFGHLQGGDIGIAIGAQYRKESLKVTFNDQALNGDLAYLIQSADYSADRGVYALFSEINLPFTQTLSAQLAARYENYESFGDSFDPKLAVLWEASPYFSLRGSLSTTFRTPSLHQAFGNQASVSEFIDPNGSRVFRADLTNGNASLKNETALASNFGIVFRPVPKVTLSVDWWRFDYENVITKQNAPQLFAAWNAKGKPCNDPTILTTNPTGPVCSFLATRSQFINAATQKIDGLDFILQYAKKTPYGDFGVHLNATYLLNFDIKTDTGVRIHALNRRNSFNFARSNQDIRGNMILSWLYRKHHLRAGLQYIGEYQNDQFSEPAEYEKIDSYLALDLQYRYDFFQQFSLALGVKNITDERPPAVKTFFGYDTQTHDARGRIFYIRITGSL